MLGGVQIPHSAGLAGHSDADVLCHAIADALLGAAGLGDIGMHFPDDDTWRGAAGSTILGEVLAKLRSGGWSVVNIDATVVAQEPRLGPHRAAMRASLAAIVQIDPDAVSVKATTTDRMGSIGRAEGISALAVALIERD